MTYVKTRRLRKWFRVYDSAVIFSMLLQSVAPAIMLTPHALADEPTTAVASSTDSKTSAPSDTKTDVTPSDTASTGDTATKVDASKEASTSASTSTVSNESVSETVAPTVAAPETPSNTGPTDTTGTASAPTPTEPAATPTDTTAPVDNTSAPAVSTPSAPDASVSSDTAPTPTVEASGDASTERVPEWIKDGNKQMTGSAVALGKTYVAPQNDQVTVTFTKLPDNPGKLSIEEVTLTDEQVTTLHALSNKAYDITSDMADGSFEYTMTLPTKSGVDQANVGVSYTETVQELNDASKVKVIDDTQNALSVDTNKGEVKIEAIDHFTIYITTYSDATLIVPSATYQQGETIYMKATGLVAGHYYRFAINPPEENNTIYVTSCQQPNVNLELTGAYTLASDAVISTGWAAEIHGFTTDNCSGANFSPSPSDSKPFSVTVAVVTPATNPSLGQSCGLDVALVLDNSGSVGSDLGTMKTAFKNFVTTLSTTPTQFSVTYFNGTAAYTQQGYSGDATATKAAIDAVPNAKGSTNWQDGLLKAKRSTDARSGVPKLVIFSSDGDPNRYYTDISNEASPDGLVGPGNGFDVASHNAAIALANSIKGSGTRIITLGIGGDSLMQTHMEAISSADAYYNATNFNENLSSTLSQIVTDLCGGTITVNKYIDSVDPANLAKDPWTFTTTVPDHASVTTTNGQVNFPAKAGSGYSISESSGLAGYSFGKASCKNTKNNNPVGTEDKANKGVTGISISNSDVISCDFVNLKNCKAGSSKLEGQVKGSTYTTGNLCSGGGDCWGEGEDVPARLTFDGLRVGDSYTVTVQHDYSDNNAVIGYDNFHSVTSGNATATGVTLGVPSSVDCGGGIICKDYTISFTASATTAQIDWLAHLSDYAGQWNGASLHYRLLEGPCGGAGGKDIPINPGQIVVKGSITPTKSSANGADPSQWTFNISGNTNVTGSVSGSTAGNLALGTNNGDATYTITEVGPTGWILDTVSAPCVKTGDATATVTLSKTTPDVSCTFTNKRQTGTLKVIKKVNNDNGGSASASAFNLHVKNGGADVSGSPAAGSASGTMYTLNAGSYSVSEDTPTNGYARTGFGGNCNSDGIVTVVAGQEQTCTITNDDIAPSLTLNKILVKNNGGTANESDWTLSATGTGQNPTNLSGQGASGTADVVSGSDFKADTYTLAESGGPSGYSASAWTCTNGVAVSANNTISLGLGQTTSCSITNTDQKGTLIVKKVVVNDNGGTMAATSFAFNVNGGTSTSFIQDGDAAHGKNTVSVNAGTYTVTEPSVSGYETTYDNCKNVVIPNGETKTCTITNNDIPAHLIVIKHVNNNSDGTKSAGQFSTTISGVTTANPTANGSEAGVDNILTTVGSYTVDEGAHAGYEKSLSSDCTGTIALGETKTCIITNDDIDYLPTIEATKTAGVSSVPESGGSVTYTYTVKNTSPADAVTITSLQDDKFGTLTGNTGCKTGTTLAMNASCTFTYTTTIKGNAGTSHVNVFTAKAKDNENNEVSASDDAMVTFIDVKPTIEVVKTAGTLSLSEPGGSVTFSVVVNNKSFESVTLMSLSDDVYGDLNGKGTCATGGIIAAGGSYSCSFDAGVYGEPGRYTDVVTAIGTDDDGSTDTKHDDATVTVTDAKPTVTIDKSVDTTGMAEPGGNFTYTLTIKNTSVETVSITALTDSNALSPACLALVGQTIAPNATKTCSYVVNHAVAGTYDNTAKVTVKDNENNVADDDDSETVKVVGARIAFDKTAATNDVNVPHTFTVTVTENDGTGWVVAPGEHVDFTLTNGSGAVSTLDAAKSTCDDAGANTNTNGQCTIVFNSATPGTVTVHASANVSVGGLTLARSTDGTLGSSNDAVKTYQAGKIVVVKQTDPDQTGNDVKDTFTFDPSWGGENYTFDLSDNGTNDSGWLAPGSYSVIEQAKKGWTQTSATCTSSLTSDSSDSIQTINPNNISLKPNEIVTCTITNTRDTGTLTVHKEVDANGDGTYEGGDVAANTLGFAWGLGTDTPARTMGSSDTPIETGDYQVNENTVDGYHYTGWFTTGSETYSCANPEGVTQSDADPISSTLPVEVTVSKDQTTDITLCNARDMGTITVDKVTTLTTNEFTKEGGTKKVSVPRTDPTKFSINLTQETASVHTYTIADQDTPQPFSVPTGRYAMAEDLTKNPGWSLDGATCTVNGGDKDHPFVPTANSFAVHANDNILCTFTNTFTTPQLKLDKFVDTEGNYSLDGSNSLQPGDSVKYIIKVKAKGGVKGEIENLSNVENVTVTDLPPAGFTYRPDSWTAKSSVGGAHIGDLKLSHVYASPGVWDLGTMVPGEVITLTYVADISATQDTGDYPDLAWAAGTDLLGATVQATKGDPELFAGTKVAVIVPEQPSVAIATVQETDTKTKTKTTTKRVLGTSTELPATGSETGWMLAALALLGAGSALVFVGKRKNKNMKNVGMFVAGSVVGLFGLSGMPTHAIVSSDSNLAVQVEKPGAVSFGPDFRIGYVVLDLDKTKTVDVKCYREGSATAFDSLTTIEGGSSGSCDVSKAGITADGTYDFYVTAYAGSGTNESEHIPVKIDISAPGMPTNYARLDPDACNKTISFTTANDGGETATVELYRSTSLSFIADASTLVATKAITSNIAGAISDTIATDCNLTYYYALRAVDADGNGSGFVGDSNVNVTNETKTRHKTRTVVVPGNNGAGTVTLNPGAAGQGGAAGNGTEQVNGAVEGAQAGNEQGTVKGAETASTTNAFQDWVIWLAGLAAIPLARVAYVMARTPLSALAEDMPFARLGFLGFLGKKKKGEKEYTGPDENRRA
ncbi:MAG: VWA domain-containing protein [Candidatus Moraniibacteriota bacterium]